MVVLSAHKEHMAYGFVYMDYDDHNLLYGMLPEWIWRLRARGRKPVRCDTGIFSFSVD